MTVRSSPVSAADRRQSAVKEVWYRVPRLTLPIPGVREFQARYENAVPDLPLTEVSDLVSRKAPWSEMVALIDRSAPHGFLIYFRNDVHPVMALAGDHADCVAYLMGNHIIAERMFRHDPRAMVYAPLHTVIWEDQRGDAWFTRRPAEQTIRQLRHSSDRRGRRRARPQARRTARRVGGCSSPRAQGVTIRGA